MARANKKPTTWQKISAALLLQGHPKVRPLACWLFFIPQLLFNLYMLGPVFVYYTQGVPLQESLETITGIWREEGNLGSNSNGLVAPRYFVDTEKGAREVHCGFPMQKRLCGQMFGARFWIGKKVVVHYDSYFGILAFEHLEPPGVDQPKAGMNYKDGVFFYSKPEDTIFKNYHAHQMLIFLIAIYAWIAYLCWRAINRQNSVLNP